MDLCIYNRGGSFYKRNYEGEAYDQRASSRASDEDDNNGSGGGICPGLRLLSVMIAEMRWWRVDRRRK